MKNLVNSILFFVLVATAATSDSGANEFFRNWTAGKVLEKRYSNFDVTLYLERALLDDAQRAELFKKAEGDYGKYEMLLIEHTRPSFEAALKLLTYNKLLEHHATFAKKVRDWKAFKISPNRFQKRIDELENKVLKPLLDKRLGIIKSRDQFGAYLIEKNFPHRADESNTDVYFRWYNDQKFRLKHELRTKEAKKYETMLAMGPRRELYVHNSDQVDFYKNGVKRIEEELNEKQMSQTQVANFLRTNPDLKLLIKDVNYLSLNSAALSRILDQSQTKFEQAKKLAINGITPSLNAEKIKKILKYEALAAKMAHEHKDQEKLLEKSKLAMKNFMASGEYKELMKTKLYELAIAIVELSPDRSKISEEITSPLRIAFDELKIKLSQTSTYTKDSNKKLLFEDLVSRELKDSFKKNLGDKFAGYLRKTLNLAAWVLEFDAKKIAVNAVPEISVTLKPYTDEETKKAIQGYLKRKEFKKLIKDFREKRLRYDVQRLLLINIDGNTELRGRQAYDWLIN